MKNTDIDLKKLNIFSDLTDEELSDIKSGVTVKI